MLQSNEQDVICPGAYRIPSQKCVLEIYTGSLRSSFHSCCPDEMLFQWPSWPHQEAASPRGKGSLTGPGAASRRQRPRVAASWDSRPCSQGREGASGGPWGQALGLFWAADQMGRLKNLPEKGQGSLVAKKTSPGHILLEGLLTFHSRSSLLQGINA